jgi:ABC-2 type transport system permease protein
MTRASRERPYSLPARARRVFALVRKEARQIVRDPSSILIAFVLPLILLFLFGYGVSLDTTRTRIGVAIERPTPSARGLLDAFRASPAFDVRVTIDRRELEQPLARGEVHGIVVIAATFDADLSKRSTSPEIDVIVDGSDPNTAALVQGYAGGVVANWARSRAIESGRAGSASDAEARFWFNPELSSRFFLVPGCIAIVMALVGTLLTSLVVAREWERGTMEAIMATPVTALELLLGKVIPYFVLALASMSLCALVAVVVFGVPFRGSLPALYAISAAFLLPSLGQGLLISAATKNQFLASQLALISAFLPTFLLSGFIFEISSMPMPIQWLTNIVAARWLIPSLQTVFLAGDIWALFLRDVGVMTFFGAVLLVLALLATKKRVA